MPLGDWLRSRGWFFSSPSGEVDEKDVPPLDEEYGEGAVGDRPETSSEMRYDIVGHEGLSKADEAPTADDIEIE
jgi:hypothetical protein